MTFKNLDSDSSPTQATELKTETHLLKKNNNNKKKGGGSFFFNFFIKYISLNIYF